MGAIRKSWEIATEELRSYCSVEECIDKGNKAKSASKRKYDGSKPGILQRRHDTRISESDHGVSLLCAPPEYTAVAEAAIKEIGKLENARHNDSNSVQRCQ